MTVAALIPQARHLAAVPSGLDTSAAESRMTFNLQISVAGSALPSEAAKVLRDIRELAEQMRRASGGTPTGGPSTHGSSSVTVTMTPVAAFPSPVDRDGDGVIVRDRSVVADRGQDGAAVFDPQWALWIEPASRTVLQAGRPVQLTRREFDLLLFLAEHPRRVFSRDQLLSHVWGYEWVGGSRTVDVHVRRLRIKLGKNGPVVRTVHGVGYRLEDDLDVRIGHPPE